MIQQGRGGEAIQHGGGAQAMQQRERKAGDELPVDGAAASCGQGGSGRGKDRRLLACGGDRDDAVTRRDASCPRGGGL